MNERQLELGRLHKLLDQNKKDIDLMKLNADQCESHIGNYQTRLEYLALEYNKKEEFIQKQLKRAITNAKNSHDSLEKLIELKKDLHVEFKKANHYGEVQCEFCGKYYTQAGLSRHKGNCASLPSKKKANKVKAEIVLEEDAIEVRKAALEKELAALKKAKPKTKAKPAKVVKAAIPPPPPILPPELKEAKKEIEKIIEDDLKERHPEPEVNRDPAGKFTVASEPKQTLKEVIEEFDADNIEIEEEE